MTNPEGNPSSGDRRQYDPGGFTPEEFLEQLRGGYSEPILEDSLPEGTVVPSRPYSGQTNIPGDGTLGEEE